MTNLEPEKIINIEGEKGCSLFYRPLKQIIDQKKFNNTQKKIDSYFKKYNKISDERALAIVGALTIENELNKFLTEWIKNYRSLQENEDLTFSFKIELAISLKLIPSWVLNAIDPIRKIRNIFAHNFNIDTFKDAKKFKSLSFLKLHSKIKQFSKYWDNKDDRETFKTLTIMIIIALNVYTEHISKVQNFIWNSENLNKIINS